MRPLHVAPPPPEQVRPSAEPPSATSHPRTGFLRTGSGEKSNCSFVPADLSPDEVADYLHAAILLNASEAGEFVVRVSVATPIGRTEGWCKWRAHHLPALPQCATRTPMLRPDPLNPRQR
jgi:hypothetical protein